MPALQAFPNWVVTWIGVASIFIVLTGFVLIILGIIGILILLSIKSQIFTIEDIVNKELRREILPSVTGTMKNVERMSNDAADTTHNVTAAANRVANLVGSAANRIESPLIKAVGIGSGLLAAGRAIKGNDKRQTVIIEKKKGGRFRGK